MIAGVNINVGDEIRKKKCSHCKKTVNCSVDCVTCGSNYHPSCAAQARVINKENKVNCCKTNTKSEVSSEKNIEFLYEMEEKKVKALVRELLSEYLNPLKETLQEEMGEIRKSIQYMSDSFEDQRTTIKRMFSEIKELKEENHSLKIKVRALEDKQNANEQKDKENNVIVVGIPKQAEETKQVINKVIKALKVEITESDIKEVYPISNKEAAPILIKLESYEAKLKIYKRIKQTKGLKVNECGLKGPHKNIFFNDDLTRYNQDLFRKARDLKRNKNIQAAFIKNGKIFIKKTEDDPPVRIRSETDLLL